MRASSQGNPYHDEKGKFARANSHAVKVVNSDEHYQEKTEQRTKEVKEFRQKANQKPSKNFQDNTVTRIDDFKIKRMSKHVRFDRKERTEFAQKLIENENASVASNFFIVSPEGKEEIHILYSNGVVKVADPDGTWVTTLIARPYQVKRYYLAMGEDAPKSILNYAVDHTVKKHYLIGLE